MIILMKCKRFDDNSIEDETLSGFDDNQSNHNHQHSNHQHVIINGKQYWIPKVPDKVKPELKGHYKSYEDIIDMYYKYALAAGFNVRKTTNRKNAQHIIRLTYLVCNRQGLPNTCPVDTLNPIKSKIQRRTDSRRTACIRFNMIKGRSTCLLYEFVEEHNHELMSQDNILFSRYHRQLNSCRNRSLSVFLIRMMVPPKLTVYILPLFRYDMVFVPFTGIDNHKKYVTFGDRLLSKEGIDLYTWLLKSFLKAFGKQPILVLSDKDPTMKNSIANVFPDSIHRLCMRHITSKLPSKVTIFHLISFQSTLHSL
uniref:Protein FAR1-RELATED SEQUENCE n=1 Tax=Lactuca sativa TaxID=4236 RepID=A0A9R1V8T5_LACSA|nr:hypothetical protein LSAT_V11C600321030 [Lactuca sativa]